MINCLSTPRTKSEMGKLIKKGNGDVFHAVSAYGHHDLDGQIFDHELLNIFISFAGRSDWFSSPENFTHTRVVPNQIR